MSLLGKNVTFITHAWENGKRRLIIGKGLILEKYLGLSDQDVTLPSGVGGTVSLNTKLNTEYYIIQTSDSLEHVECSQIRSVI